MRPKLYPPTALPDYLAGLEPSSGNAQSNARSGVASGRSRERRSAQLQASFTEPDLKLNELRPLEAQGFMLDTTHDQFDDTGLVGYVFGHGREWHRQFASQERRALEFPSYPAFFPAQELEAALTAARPHPIPHEKAPCLPA
jgi:hypothetical protein